MGGRRWTRGEVAAVLAAPDEPAFRVLAEEIRPDVLRGQAQEKAAAESASASASAAGSMLGQRVRATDRSKGVLQASLPAITAPFGGDRGAPAKPQHGDPCRTDGPGNRDGSGAPPGPAPAGDRGQRACPPAPARARDRDRGRLVSKSRIQFRVDREARRRKRSRRCVRCRRRYNPTGGHPEKCPECARPAPDNRLD